MLRWSVNPVGGDHYLVIVAVAVGLVLLTLLVGPSFGGTVPRRRRILHILRLSVVAMLVVAMLRPAIVYTDTSRQSATVLLVFDKSRSMSVPDAVNGRTRWEALRQTVENARGQLAELAERFEVKAYTFDVAPQPVGLQGGSVELADLPDGPETAIGACLEDLLREHSGKRVLGVLLFSDGAQRAYPPRDILPQTVAARMKHLGWPLFTFRFGQARGLGQAQDVAVTELVADQTVFVKNELSISGQVRIDGYANRPVPLRLVVQRPDGQSEVAGQQEVQVAGDGQRVSVRFSFIPQQAGEYKLTLEAEVQPGELVTTNNAMTTFVNALKGGLRVLYLEADWRPEVKFLRRSLDASPDIHVDYRRFDPERPETRPGDADQFFRPDKYDVFMLGDIDSTAFSNAEWGALRDRVEHGAGLIMLGGGHSFGPGGYATTPLADVLPVEMHANERQQKDTPFPPDLHILQPVRMIPTQLGQMHFSLRLAYTAGQSAAKWAQLPPLDGANRLREKRTARVLAATEDNQPLLVAHDFGEGRVLAFAGDSTWRWWMHGFQAEHKRFWRQIVLWLAKKDQSTEGNVWIKLAQRRFAPGQRVEASFGAQSPTGEPIADAAYRVEVEMPGGGKQVVSAVGTPEGATASFQETFQPGDYTFVVTASQGQQELGSTRARFTVFQQDLELDNATAEAGTLDNLAAISGGQSHAPEELPSVLKRFLDDVESLEVAVETRRSLWDTWPFFLLLVSLLGTEWFLRKRWGLV